MTCTTCAGSIEKALSTVPGVSRASVNFAAEKATAEYDPSMASESALIKAVENRINDH